MAVGELILFVAINAPNFDDLMSRALDIIEFLGDSPLVISYFIFLKKCCFCDYGMPNLKR